MRVIFVLSSADRLPAGRPVGCWLEELLAPYYLLLDHGADIEIATPLGGSAPIDPASVEALTDNPLMARFLADAQLRRRLAATHRIADISPLDFDAAIYPGGYSPMLDLRADKASIELIGDLLVRGKVVGTICHGGAVLLEVMDQGGRPIVKGLALTSFTNSEEDAVGMRHDVPYLVETELRARGARFSAAPDWQKNVITSGNLVTGQNPASAQGVGEEVIRLIDGKRRSAK